MSIKNLKPNSNSGFIQGYYNPINPDKYIGPTPIIYRSSWERKFCIMCDTKENVLKWSSEPVTIKYKWTKDGREHKYYPDFYMKTAGENDEAPVEWLVEIAPHYYDLTNFPPGDAKRKLEAAYRNVMRSQ